MKKWLVFSYGVFCFLLFSVTYVYFIVFISHLFQPKWIDLGAETTFVHTLLIDLGLVSLFGFQHSVMARHGFKQWWVKFVPHYIERSTYIFISCLVLILLMWQWRSLPIAVWHVDNAIGYWILVGFFWFGWLLIFLQHFLLICLI